MLVKQRLNIRVVGARQLATRLIEPEAAIDFPVVSKEFQAAPSNSPSILVLISAGVCDLSVRKEHYVFACSGVWVEDQYEFHSLLN